MEKKYSLPKEFGEKWVKVLRSGKYQQGRSQLKNGNAYCCLGVACAMQGINKFGNKEWIGYDGEYNVLEVDEHKIPELLIGTAGSSSFIHTVSTMNDNVNLQNEHMKTFNDIADYIEQNVQFI